MSIEGIKIEDVRKVAALVRDVVAADEHVDKMLFDLVADGRFWPEFQDLWETTNRGSRRAKSFTGSADAAIALAFALVPEHIADVLVGAGESIRWTSKDKRTMLPIQIVSVALDFLARGMQSRGVLGSALSQQA